MLVHNCFPCTTNETCVASVILLCFTIEPSFYCDKQLYRCAFVKRVYRFQHPPPSHSQVRTAVPTQPTFLLNPSTTLTDAIQQHNLSSWVIARCHTTLTSQVSPRRLMMADLTAMKRSSSLDFLFFLRSARSSSDPPTAVYSTSKDTRDANVFFHQTGNC